MTAPDPGPSPPLQSGSGRAPAGTDHPWIHWVYPLRIIPQPWQPLTAGALTKPAVTVIGAWLVLAWNRFGPQALLNPRALTRFALVGFYGWLGLALGLWLIAVLRRWAAGPDGASPDGPVAFARLTGLAHQPLLIAAFLMLILQLLPIIEVRTAIAFAAVVVWMPAQLIALTSLLEKQPWHRVAATTLLVWSAWLTTVGWFLFQRLSHVI